MRNSILVSKTTRNVNRKSYSTSSNSRLTATSSQQSIAPLKQKETVSFRMSCVRSKLKSKGLSKKSIKYIANSWRPSTNKKYDFIWNKWVIWCNQRKVNPMRPSCDQIINYLSGLAENDFSYYTINAHKAAIVQTLAVCNNFSFAEDPMIIRFMRGVFIAKRPKPKYTMTWDVGKVLDYLKSLYPLENLDIKTLTLKTVSLIALTTAQRVQTLVSLKINQMADHVEYVVFTIDELQKTSRPGHDIQQVKISSFPDKSC